MRKSTKISIANKVIKNYIHTKSLRRKHKPTCSVCKEQNNISNKSAAFVCETCGKPVCMNHVYISIIKGQYHFYDKLSCAPTIEEKQREYNTLTEHVEAAFNTFLTHRD